MIKNTELNPKETRKEREKKKIDKVRKTQY